MKGAKLIYYTQNKKKRRRLLGTDINKNNDSDDDEQLPFPFPLPDLLNKQPEKKKVFRDNNHIYFRDSVSIDTVNKLCNLIQEINNEYNEITSLNEIGYVLPKPIYVHICSMGGDLFAGFMAYDFIKNSNIPVYTVAEGYTVSAGSIMFMGGKKRFMIPSGYVLIHQLRNETGGGTAFELTDEYNNCKEDPLAYIYSLLISKIDKPMEFNPDIFLKLKKMFTLEHLAIFIQFIYETETVLMKKSYIETQID